MFESTGTRPDLSVIILAGEPGRSIAEFYSECVRGLADVSGTKECVIAGEPWTARRADEVRAASDPSLPVRMVVSAQSLGATGLLRIALGEARADRLLILTDDRRVDAASLPGVVVALADADVVLGRRINRRDSFINRIQERAFNWLVAKLTSCRFSDLGSGVRALRREVLERVPLYGESYRFLPVLAKRDGFRVEERDVVPHAAGERGAQLQWPTVYLRRALDVFGLYFLVRFTEKPLRFFGLVGGLLAIVGAIVMAILFVQRIMGTGIADRPLLLLGVLLLVLGVQVIALGLVGEIIVHTHASRTRRYRLARNVDER